MGFEPDARRWAETMFGAADLGDKRRTKRLVKIAAAGAAHPELSLSAATADAAEAEAAYRFMRNDDVSAERIAEAGFNAVAVDAKKCRWLIAIGDTTTLTFPGSPATDLGDSGGPDGAPAKSMLAHSMLAVDGDTHETIGLLEQKRWVRRPDKRGKSRKKGPKMAYEEKESFKWEETIASTAGRLGEEAAKNVVYVLDREADLWPLLTAMSMYELRYVIRAHHDRELEETPAGCTHPLRLREQACRGRLLGETDVRIEQKGDRPARTARVEIRAARVTVSPPRGAAPGCDEPLEITVVLARETEKSARGVESPIEWFLLTTESATTLEEALKVLGAYALRWRVEEFHKCWKSGARVEDLRMETAANLERAAVIKAFDAVRLLQLSESLGHDRVPRITGAVAPKSDRPCTRVLSEDDWKVLWAAAEPGKEAPAKPPTLKWAYYALAALGGWKDTKRTGRVGWEALWRAWDRLQQRVAGYRAALAAGAG